MSALGYIVTSMYLPSLPEIARYLDTTKVQVHSAVSLYFLGLFVFMIISNVIMARLGEIETLIYGAIIFTVTSVVCVFAEGLLWL